MLDTLDDILTHIIPKHLPEDVSSVSVFLVFISIVQAQAIAVACIRTAFRSGSDTPYYELYNFLSTSNLAIEGC